MIWALLAWYLLGGATSGGAILTSTGVAQLRDRVEIVVADEARQSAAEEIFNRLHDDVRAFEKSFSKSGKRLNKLYKLHEDNRPEALAILDNLNAEWATGQARALDARFALREELTREEWVALLDRD